MIVRTSILETFGLTDPLPQTFLLLISGCLSIYPETWLPGLTCVHAVYPLLRRSLLSEIRVVLWWGLHLSLVAALLAYHLTARVIHSPLLLLVLRQTVELCRSLLMR